MDKILFVMSDIHSFYEPMQKALNKAGFDINNKNHIFVNCGDLFDRGDDSLKVLRWVNALPDERKILIRGNHELLMDEAMERRYFMGHDFHNGTAITAYDLCTKENAGVMNHAQILGELRDNKEYKKYIDSLVNYEEIGDYVFVHSFIPLGVEDWRNASASDWYDSMWGNPFNLIKMGFWNENKILVFGHYHTSYAWEQKDGLPEFGPDAKFDIFYGDNYIGIDGCVAYQYGQCNCLRIEI